VAAFLDNVMIGDEASFSMNGQVNTRNVREYAPRGNPPAFNYDRSNSRTSVWVGITGNGAIIGPTFSREYQRLVLFADG